MTSIVLWVAVDAHGPTSINLASDSRISWSNAQKISHVWDFGRKLFASKKYPEILGYCGDVLFPSQVIGQIVEHIDTGILFDINDAPEIKLQKILKLVQQSFSDYPNNFNEWQGSEIVYCTRQNCDVKSIFYAWILRCTSDKGWSVGRPLTIPTTSGIIEILGSGKTIVKKYFNKLNDSELRGTSRIVFTAFCDALKSNEDPRTGGVPQLVAIHRTGTAKSFGVIYNNERYLLGLPVDQEDKWEGVNWRNELFERCDGMTMSVLDGAQRHARPNGG